MVKVLFLQEISFEHMAPMYLSSVLKENNHTCKLIIPKEEGKDWINKVINFKPDIILFSVLTGTQTWSLNISNELKKILDFLSVFGGAHPTFFHNIIESEAVDIICIGEGEEAIVELANKIEKNKDFTKIKNLWVKKKNKLYKNSLRPLISNLDNLPFPDRSLYDNYPSITKIPVKRFLASRGCPYPCTYCFNHSFKKIYHNPKNYVRFRSPENIVEEIKQVKKKYLVKSIRFPDDILTIKKKWLLSFLDLYVQEINLPFTCLVRANELDEEVVKKLKKSGCTNVFFGIETGNDKLRNDLLKRNMSKDQIIASGKLLKKHKLKFGTFNMFGLPGETLNNSFETVELNIIIKPDYPISTIFQPYPGTELGNFLVKSKHQKPLDINSFTVMSGGSLLNLNQKREILNLQMLFYFYVKLPFLSYFFKKLIKLKANIIYKFLYNISLAITMKASYGLGLFDTLKLGLKLYGKL